MPSAVPAGHAGISGSRGDGPLPGVPAGSGHTGAGRQGAVAAADVMSARGVICKREMNMMSAVALDSVAGLTHPGVIPLGPAVADSRGASADPVFVLCMGRTGSTLLRFLLDAHPDLACPPETNVSALCGQLANVWAHLARSRRLPARGRGAARAGMTATGCVS
jgi:hypothetical protein